MFYVSRQVVWPEGNKVVEVVSPGLDHAGPDMLTPKFKNLGEGQEFASPIDAFEAANQVRNAWQAINKDDDEVTIEFLGETGTDEELGALADALEAKIQKCDQCGEPLPGQRRQFKNHETGELYCSRECADRASEFEEEQRRELDREDEDEDDAGEHEYSGSVRAKAAQQLVAAAKLLIAAETRVKDAKLASPLDDFLAQLRKVDLTGGPAWDVTRVADGPTKGETWRLSFARGSITVDELPQKGLRKLRKARLETFTDRGWQGLDPLIPENIIQAAKLDAKDSFDTVKSKILKAAQEGAERALSKMDDKGKNSYSFITKSLAWSEESIPAQAHKPDDANPIRAKGKDFTVESKWNDFAAYDPGADFQSHDPTYSVINPTSESQARKLYKILAADPNALADVTWSDFRDWLKAKGIASKMHHSVYR